jgi:cytochrome c553
VPEYIVKSLHDFKAGRRSNEVMSPQAQAVAEVDMADIAAWFGSQKVQPNKAQNKELLAQGEKIFMKGKGRPDVIAACVGCHGLKGVGNRDWAKIMSNPRRAGARHWRPACRLSQRSAQGLQVRQARHRSGQGDARHRRPHGREGHRRRCGVHRHLGR